MTQARFAFRGIHQNITALKICSQLYAGWKACAAHTDKTCCFYHVEFAAHLFQFHIFLGLLFVGNNYDHLIVHRFHCPVNTRKNICAKPGRFRNQRTLFYIIASVNRWLTWPADMLL